MEFHAVVLCGQGTRLEPITGEEYPKALLPVGNKPLILHTLEWCKNAGFRDITVVANSSHADLISKAAKIPVRGVKGVEDAISQLENVKSDFVLVPVDFITDIDPKELVKTHRNATDALVSGFYYKNTIEQIDKKLFNPDLLVSSNGRLLDAYDRAHTKDKKYLDLRMAMLWKFPNVRVTSDVLASGIYFCQHKVIKLLTDIDGVDIQDKPIWKIIRDLGRRTWQHHEVLEQVRMHNLDGFFIRSNILPAYVEANRFVLKQAARDNQNRKFSKQKEGPSIGPDSIVDATAQVGDKSSIKRTVIGVNCVIGPRCRINGCVILNDVVIDTDVVLENCTIGARAAVRPKSHLTSCTVECGYVVAPGLSAKNEVLQGAIEVEAVEMYEEGQSSESGSEVSEFDDYEVSDDDDDLFDRS